MRTMFGGRVAVVVVAGGSDAADVVAAMATKMKWDALLPHF